jgi:hypothetical protein
MGNSQSSNVIDNIESIKNSIEKLKENLGDNEKLYIDFLKNKCKFNDESQELVDIATMFNKLIEVGKTIDSIERCNPLSQLSQEYKNLQTNHLFGSRKNKKSRKNKRSRKSRRSKK